MSIPPNTIAKPQTASQSLAPSPQSLPVTSAGGDADFANAAKGMRNEAQNRSVHVPVLRNWCN